MPSCIPVFHPVSCTPVYRPVSRCFILYPVPRCIILYPGVSSCILYLGVSSCVPRCIVLYPGVSFCILYPGVSSCCQGQAGLRTGERGSPGSHAHPYTHASPPLTHTHSRKVIHMQTSGQACTCKQTVMVRYSTWYRTMRHVALRYGAVQYIMV